MGLTFADNSFTIKFISCDHFFMTKAGQLRYKDEEHHSIGNDDPDRMSKVELDAICREDVKLIEIREL